MSIGARIDKQDVVCAYSGILLNLKMEGNSDTRYNAIKLQAVC